MTNEWNEEKEETLERLKEERRLVRKIQYAEKGKEKAKVRRERYRAKMKSTHSSVGFQMDKALYEFIKTEGVPVGRSVQEISEALAIYAIQNGTTFSQAITETIENLSQPSQEYSNNSPDDHPQIDPAVRDALSN